MSRLFRTIVGLLAAIVLTALFEPLVVSWLTDSGYYDEAAKAVNWLADIVGVEAFPWVAAGTMGLAVGAWIDWIARRHDTSSKAKITDLGRQLIKMHYEIDGMMREWQYQYEKRWASSTTARLNALVASLRSAGIEAPQLSDILDYGPEPAANNYAVYCQVIGNLLIEGHLADAKSTAKQFDMKVITTSDNQRRLPLNIEGKTPQ